MKSTDNRYRPPRVQSNIDNWARFAPKKPLTDNGRAGSGPKAPFGKKKKRKP